ncbi:aldose 1-epimerase [Aromatoleum diolicum]|uniref:Aldose 1-epimerase n=1 Tax=Aromatoleum diolicum TaxID=75796 RepID=A0ABX1QEN8_9RHOO|nr:aldose 1-epimerase [Aromatoleum diolicum]NMG76897.1 aldose 1-epimerase [Aromatoleum diolicum]
MTALPATVASVVANPFRVRKVEFADIAAVELRDEYSGAYAVFALRGATLLDWRVPHGDELVELTDGYVSAAELASQNGVRNGILAPFPNRIADGRYRFDGREHDLLPGVAAAERLIYHGFLRGMELAVADIQEVARGASVLFTGVIGPDAFPGYPFALEFDVRVSLTARSIALVVTATNVGDRAAPCAAGWHPYFRLGDAELASLELTVPATRCIVTDNALIPRAGEAAFAPIAKASMPDFRLPRRLGTDVLDGCYADAAPDADGLIRSRLRDPANGRQLTIWQRSGLTHVFTADTLARDARRAIAIEPVEAMTDAFNRPDCESAIRLAPGARRSFACGAEFDAESDPVPLFINPLAVMTA